MWILLLIATIWSVAAFLTNHQRQALLIITFLATGGFQLLPIHWFWSPLSLVKPYDYAFVAMGMIFVLRFGELMRIIAAERMAKAAVAYVGFVALVLAASVAVYSYPVVQSVQSARVFFWPLFLLLFLLVERVALDRFVATLLPIVLGLCALYLLQPLTGKTIINPSGEHFNPYLGTTDMKRYLSTPDFLIFFLLLAYHKLVTYKGKALGVLLGHCLGLALLLSVQMVSLTRSAIIGTGLALLYLSKRLVNPILVIFFLASVSVAAAVAYSTSSTIEHRIDDSLKDIGSTFDGDFLKWRAGKDGNLSYRIAHFNERLTYVLDSARRWPIGLAMIHEDSATAQQLGFKIGTPSPFTGKPVQVDTGDIAWSVVVIKTGLAGIVAIVLFLFVSFRTVGSSADKYAVVYRGGLLYFLVTSFFSTNLVTPNYMLPLMLFLALGLRAQAHAPVPDGALAKLPRNAGGHTIAPPAVTQHRQAALGKG